MKKKLLTVLVAAALAAATLVSCGKQNDTITVVSREDGSGTRGAFTELMGIEKDGTDRTYAKAEISNSTSVVISTVAGNKNAIGYISLGSLNDSVKAVKVDGVDATVDNVKNGSYKISRPFIIATKDGISELAADFIKFILSDDGQIIVSEKYITVGGSGAYTASGLSGKVTLAGSTSVSPLMDEPTSALDPISTAKIEELTLELKKNYTIVIVTHNMQQAKRISDKTAFFLLGEMVEFDTTDTIFTAPHDTRTADYVCGRFG